MKLISRREAIKHGEIRYFTGEACVNGHISLREVNGRRCIECRRATDRARYRKNPEKERERSRVHGWKHNKYPTPTHPCPDRCELCGGLPTKRRLHLDHNHKTKKFRGWLCHYCNTNLGRFGDTLEGLQRAMIYLQKTDMVSILPATADARKDIPISSGVLDYFPSALIEVAKVSYQGNLQHNPGQPLHWARGKSTDQNDTIIRHFLERGKIDIDGMRHSAKLAWRTLALLQLELEAEGAPLARGARLPEEKKP